MKPLPKTLVKANEWDVEKQLVMLPMLLHGKLLNKNVELDAEVKADFKKLHAALLRNTGPAEDSLFTTKAFVSHNQQLDERVADFASAFKKLFHQAYPNEWVTSTILLQRFLTGLWPPIRQQLLLRAGRPEELTKAIQDAEELEYALGFDQAGAG